MARLMHRGLSTAWQTWQEVTLQRRAALKTLSRFFVAMLMRDLSGAWRKMLAVASHFVQAAVAFLPLKSAISHPMRLVRRGDTGEGEGIVRHLSRWSVFV